MKGQEKTEISPNDLTPAGVLGESKFFELCSKVQVNVKKKSKELCASE